MSNNIKLYLQMLICSVNSRSDLQITVDIIEHDAFGKVNSIAYFLNKIFTELLEGNILKKPFFALIRFPLELNLIEREKKKLYIVCFCSFSLGFEQLKLTNKCILQRNIKEVNIIHVIFYAKMVVAKFSTSLNKP